MPINSATKKCNQCKVIKPVSEFYKGSKASRSKYMYACKECVKRQVLIHYKRLFKENPVPIRERKRLWQEMNRDIQKKSSLKFRLKVRNLVIIGYGGKCSCCGETEIKFLSIDHIDGGGKEHRKETSGHVYEDLLKRRFPKGYQILCHNCNLAKGFYGRCPHQDARA